MIFIPRCYALSPSVIEDLYKHFENTYSKFCYTRAFEKWNGTESFRSVREKNLIKNTHFKKMNYQRKLPAYEKAALVSVVKDEEDIIFENLCWHYFMGFRKFIVVDNGSADATGQLIDRFKELTAGSAHVIKIDDPEISFKQTSRLNACFRLAEILFPEIAWIFPNDADEFYVVDDSLEKTLFQIPLEVNCVYATKGMYIAADDYFAFDKEAKFYERIHNVHKKNPFGFEEISPIIGKTFIRAHQGLAVVRGFHFASCESRSVQQYAPALELGVHIREFHIRSPEQAIKKFINKCVALNVLEKTYKEVFHHDIH